MINLELAKYGHHQRLIRVAHPNLFSSSHGILHDLFGAFDRTPDWPPTWAELSRVFYAAQDRIAANRSH
jgi:hypothetical protein